MPGANHAQLNTKPNWESLKKTPVIYETEQLEGDAMSPYHAVTWLPIPLTWCALLV